jgi:hypothetical protein
MKIIRFPIERTRDDYDPNEFENIVSLHINKMVVHKLKEFNIDVESDAAANVALQTIINACVYRFCKKEHLLDSKVDEICDFQFDLLRLLLDMEKDE